MNLSFKGPKGPHFGDRVKIDSIKEGEPYLRSTQSFRIESPRHNVSFVVTQTTYCAANGTSRLSQEQIRILYATFRDNLQYRNGSLHVTEAAQLDMLVRCENKWFEVLYTYPISRLIILSDKLLEGLDYERSPFHLLLFTISPSFPNDDCERNIYDIALAIIEVDNVNEPPVISDCKNSDGRTKHTLIEANSEVQQICNITVTFDDQQKRVECNVTEMSNMPSRFEAVRIDLKERDRGDGFLLEREEGSSRVPIKIAGWWAKYELRTLKGVGFRQDSARNISLTFTCAANLHNKSQQILIDVLFPLRLSRTHYDINFAEGPITAWNVNATFLKFDAFDERNRELLFSLDSQIEHPIQGSLFTIENETSLLSARIGSEFDREEMDTYQLMVIVRDRNTPALSATMLIDIQLKDVNDNCPRITIPSERHQAMFPNGSPLLMNCRDPVTTTIFRLFGQDADLNLAGLVRFELLSKTYFEPNGDELRSLRNDDVGTRLNVVLDESSGEIKWMEMSICEYVGYQIEMKVRAVDSSAPFLTSRHVTLRVFFVDSQQHMPTSVLVTLLLMLLAANGCCFAAQCSRPR